MNQVGSHDSEEVFWGIKQIKKKERKKERKKEKKQAKEIKSNGGSQTLSVEAR